MMIKIADIVGRLNQYQAAHRELELCRQRATGDVEYYSFSYRRDFEQAADSLEQTLNAYIDQRIAQRQAPALLEPITPGVPLAA
jgi:hypothetical protein